MENNIIEKIRQFDKDYFNISDLEKILDYNRPTLRVMLYRLAKKNEVIRLAKGIYALPEKIEIEKIATAINPPSYISFESALSKYGILSQIPYTLTLATSKKPKKKILNNIQVEYRQLKKDLFFGYKLENGIYIAEPEKALLDELYLISKGKVNLDLNELDLKPIRKIIFLEYSKKFPRYTQKIVKRLILFLPPKSNQK